MNREFWLQRWAQGEIGFHQPEVNFYLQRYWHVLGVPAGASVLVTLCGKSRDMMWLRAQGHPVFGIEISRYAAEQFFEENALQAHCEHRPPFLHYSAAGVSLLVGDIFDLQPSAIGVVDAVYDRASLVALPPAMRLCYAERLTALLRPGGSMLLITFEYDQQQMPGPPFAVPESEVNALYRGAFQLEILCTADVLTLYPCLHARGLTGLQERVYRLVRRG
ncbi:thiopurine S-methyltransferase [Nitrococcus mobilis]|uniref:Thiopurine S-methyltransferase n=1 Tax=Nitrococcus mobilis Nb-231 TaxID=314278 RepID=A4BSE5_9GAMM|nr:thiopurine S-methyltransferase [Nitrococcus mobilis]EAR21405.1 Thiopurine S-methyltransferase [Nitrococcus mobilis Nb-231]